MTRSGSQSLRALVLAPSGRDAPLTVSLLKESGFGADICADLPTLTIEMKRGAGLVIIADEAVHSSDLRALVNYLSGQPAWSDLPIILLTHRGGGPERNPAALRLGELLGNVSFLERPFHPTTFSSMVRAAARGRRRQYEARARLEEISEREQQLQTALTAGRLDSWTLDVDKMMFHASDSSGRRSGGALSQAFSLEDLQKIVHPDDIARLNEALELTLRSGADYVIEHRVLGGNGAVRWIEVRARTVRNVLGQVVSLVGVSSDITARKIRSWSGRNCWPSWRWSAPRCPT